MEDSGTEPGVFEVQYQDGVYIPELDLWLDPHRARDRAFVSHAHADHFARHERILCSRPTFDFLQARFGLGRERAVVMEFGRRYRFRREYEVRLYPAGHIFGSAQLHVTRCSDGATLLYTGDFKLREGLSAEKIDFAPAGTLIMETTFGLPHFRFPDPDQVLAQVVKFCREGIEAGETPVLAGYSLGKAQEILMALRGEEMPVMLHRSVYAMTEVYARLQPACPPYRLLDPAACAGHVVIVPPSAIRSQAIRRIRPQRSAVLTGWAMQAGARFRYQVDQAFPLSDHADYGDLLRYVEMVRPRQVWTLHGYASEFSRDLRERGHEAWTLLREDQMDLPLELGKDSPPVFSGGPVLSRAPCPFAEFVDVCERIGSTTGIAKKADVLSTYFLTLSEANLQRAANYLTGRPLPGRDERRSMQVGWALVRKALLQVSGLTEGRFRELSFSQNEPGRTAYLALQGCTHPRATSLLEIARFFRNLKEARGPLAKVELLADRLRFLHPLEAKVLVQILMGDLCLGLKDGLVEEAMADAFRQPVEDVRRAHMLLGDLGMAALFAKRNRLAEAELSYFTPVHCMLASPEDSADSVWERLGPAGGRGRSKGGHADWVWLEEKYDGIRVQLHRRGERVSLYSRDLRLLDAEFPEVVQTARDGFAHDVILDGEVIAFSEGRKLGFIDLQTRLGRRRMEGDLFLGQAAPVQFVAFDVLSVDGIQLLDEPLWLRRQILESLSLPQGIVCIERRLAAGPRDIEEAFRAARRNGNEGLIAKDPESVYKPGRRGKSWLKLKRALASLDVVVVKVEPGHGKRRHVFSDYTFAVRDDSTGELVTLGKAFTGLSDEEIETLTEHFREYTLSEQRRCRCVQPNVVLEVAFDTIRPSRRHRSGLALRFPRIRAVRRDKTVGDIDTLQTARKLAGLTEQAVG